MARMCAAVVPQQPPTMLSQPWSTNCSSWRGERFGRLAGTGRPRWAGRRSDSRRCASRRISWRVRMWSVMNSGPVAQFRPMESRSAWAMEAQKASAVWPASMVPIGSMVPETMIGMRMPSSRCEAVDGEQRGLDVARVLAGFDQQRCRRRRRSGRVACVVVSPLAIAAKVTPPVTVMALVVGPMEPATKRGLAGWRTRPRPGGRGGRRARLSS